MKSRMDRFWAFARRASSFVFLLTFALASSGVDVARARVPLQDGGGGGSGSPPPPREKANREQRLAALASLVQGSARALDGPSLDDLKKLDGHLQDLLADVLTGREAGAAAAARHLRSAGKAVLVDVYVQGSLEEAARELEAIGMQVMASDEAYGGVVEGYLTPHALLTATQLSSTRAVRAVGPAGKNTGSVTSEGDAAHNAPAARLMGEDGAGVVVGIISDSMNQVGTKIAGSQGGGDLPGSVTVLLDDTNLSWVADEGRAMGEIIYDTAPGITEMYFSSGTTAGAVEKATSINNLVSSGVDLIADDIYFLEEPFFQDGVISQAVDNANAAGVAYFAAAGNRGRQSYEQVYRSLGLYWEGYGDLEDEPHDFDPGAGEDPYQTILGLYPGQCLYAVLQWDNPWGVQDSGWDFDWYFWDGVSGYGLTASYDNNYASGIPMEWVWWCNDSDWAHYDGSMVAVENEIDWWHAEGYEGPTPTNVQLKYIVDSDMTFNVAEYDTSSPAINPEAAAAAGSMAVAAIGYDDTGLNDPEGYSSRGPLTRLFNSAGVRLGSPEVRQKPQIAGADCVITSSTFEGGLPFGGAAFCGTSAAAPSVAGVAALTLGARPNLSPTLLYDILQRSTIDCTASGNPDTDCGYGFALADEAVILARGMRSNFDGDAKSEPIKFYPATGAVSWLETDGMAWNTTELGGDTYDYIPRSDFDGDGKTDLAKFAGDNSLWYIASTTGNWVSDYMGPGVYTFVSGSDFDSDGITDPAQFNAGINALWYRPSSTGTWQGLYTGPGTYSIVSGSDFDGDGESDPAHFSSASNVLWYLKSSTDVWTGVYLGPGTYEYVEGGDYDGDGRTDPATFDDTTGVLWYQESSTGTWIGVYVGAGDRIGAADFDGDGKTDPGQFTGDVLWYIPSATGGLGSFWMGTYDGYVVVN